MKTSSRILIGLLALVLLPVSLELLGAPSFVSGVLANQNDPYSVLFIYLALCIPFGFWAYILGSIGIEWAKEVLGLQED